MSLVLRKGTTEEHGMYVPSFCLQDQVVRLKIRDSKLHLCLLPKDTMEVSYVVTDTVF